MEHANILRNTLLIDAGASLLAGVAALLFAPPLAQITGIAPWILYVLGAGLVIFAADVALVATRKKINPLFVKAIIAANIAWVIGSGLVLYIYQDRLTFEGMLVIELLAVAVALLTAVEAVSLRRLRTNTPRTA